MLFIRGEEQTYVKRLICFTKKKCCGIPRIRIIKINREGMMHRVPLLQIYKLRRLKLKIK